MQPDRFLPTRTRQHTLCNPVSCIGIGLHTGRHVAMTLRPAAPHHGIRFLRKDVGPDDGLIPARWHNVVSTELSTVLANDRGVTVGTVEHVLAALRGSGIDNALIELDAPEVPILDGSARPFAEMIDAAGVASQEADRWAIWIQSPVVVHAGERFAMLLPDRESRISAEIDFPNTAIGHQRFTLDSELDFRSQIASARTFGFASDIENLVARGLARGGSLNNAVLVDGKRVINPQVLRFANEFVRHKVLDCLGDLTLIGVPVVGHLYAYKPGHAINHALIRKLFADSTAWSFMPMGAIDELSSQVGSRSVLSDAPEPSARTGSAH